MQKDQLPVASSHDEPTMTPAGQVPEMGVHTEEDVQRYFDGWPEEYKLAVASDPISEFETLLIQAVETHDFDAMRSLMGDSFGVAGWRSEGWAYTPDEAIEQLRLNYLKAENTVRFQGAPDLSQQLDGRDILSVWNPAVNPVSALFSVGWGTDGKAEAFLIVAPRPDGTVYWEGILIGPSGFADSGATQPVIEPSVTISPLSGPSGTLVQIVAGGFPPYAPISVSVGPQNSEFGELARGTTDANGVFTVQVPVPGAPGMNLVFAVSAEGQPGVSSPDLFHITDMPEPSVTISPLGGPPGTLVQVVASGFPPYAPVSVGVGPQNSEFGELARGTTDANGVFTVQVPAQGAPGMNLVFAVGAEGQPGVSSPDLFHITDVPAASVTVLETDVKYVMALLEIVPMYNGPGDTYNEIGGIFGGMAGTVTGISADGQWWRVMCPDDTIGSCWISADPNVTEPTTPPGF